MKRSVICLACALALAVPSAAAASRTAAGLVRGPLAGEGLSLRYDEPVSQLNPDGEAMRASGGSGVREEKNPILAMVMSFALPGWGEFYTGHDGRGRAFMAAEGAIWIGYASFSVQERMRIDDYEEHVEIYLDPSADLGGTYYEDIADYIRSEGVDSYNEDIRSEARSLYPDDPAAQERYFEEHGYFGDDAWDWGTRDRLEQYRDLRHDASVSGRNAFYMTGLAFLNRVLSGIDAAWMARQHNAGRDGSGAPRFSVAPVPDENGLCGGRATIEFTF